MSRIKALIAVLVAASVLAGCGGRSGTIPVGGEGDDAFGGSNGGFGAETSGLAGGSNVSGSAEEMARRELMQDLLVYFEYDSIDIRPEFNDMLAAHGRYLAGNPGVQVRLEGHADERGSREYNIGLGERRAQAVRRVLMLQGAVATQLSTVSYGEERPATLGSDDEAYSLNRRVELVYR